MRIISGKAKGRRLAEFVGTEIRPTPDRVREALFSILTSRLGNFTNLNILELFAGSGAQSLEAISRGASFATMVDSGKPASGLITENIRRCHFEENTRFISQDVFSTLPALTTGAPFDLILLDPPYRQNLVPKALEQIATLNLLSDHGLICAETSREEILENCESFILLETRVYGTTRIHLFGQAENYDE